LTLKVDDKLICDSVASYGKAGAGMGAKEPAPMVDGGHGHGGANQEHLTSMSPCFGDKLGLTQLKKGQKWLLEAHYDFDK
jgi:hypothetical protein